MNRTIRLRWSNAVLVALAACFGMGTVCQAANPPQDHDVRIDIDNTWIHPASDWLQANGIECNYCHVGHGPSFKPTFFMHAPGYEDPRGNGCTQCHGADLRGGTAGTCFVCHGNRWDPHDFAQERWLPQGENHCHVCHKAPTFNGGTDSTPLWNHAPNPATTYTVTIATVATVGQPTGTSLKCMDCHQGRPDGEAVDAFGSIPGGKYYVNGEEAFGTNLAQHHPISLAYLDADQRAFNDPATSKSGLTWAGTINDDMLESGQLECTSCHDQHDNSKGNYLVQTAKQGLCFVCHRFSDPPPLQHHIPGRLDPWGSTRGTTFNCTMCHGADLTGEGGVPGCTTCHNDFSAPDAPAAGHHGGDRTKPYFDCATCHADPLTGVVTGNQFGNLFARSCYQCHDDLWNVGGNEAPLNVAMPALAGTVGQAVSFDASGITDPEDDPIAHQWMFGDGSQSQMPSHTSTTTHTYDAAGTYRAALSVTDGVNPPQTVEFDVVIADVVRPPGTDRWAITTTHPTPEVFNITFEDRDGSLVGTRDDGTLSFGIEFVGVIFWMDLWMDLTGNAYWGTGDMYFGNIDRDAGTMTGVVFGNDGGVFTFGATVVP